MVQTFIQLRIKTKSTNYYKGFVRKFNWRICNIIRLNVFGITQDIEHSIYYKYTTRKHRTEIYMYLPRFEIIKRSNKILFYYSGHIFNYTQDIFKIKSLSKLVYSYITVYLLFFRP